MPPQRLMVEMRPAAQIELARWRPSIAQSFSSSITPRRRPYRRLWVVRFVLDQSEVQRAGFEPAKQYVLGPHPSAFDQARQPLRL